MQARTLQHKKRIYIELMGHATCSLDLTNNDFLFPHIKNELSGQRFSTPEETVEALKTHVLELRQSQWKKCFENPMHAKGY